MDSYDFNTTYGPLKVYNQGVEGACVSYTLGLARVAAVKMRENRVIGWVDPDYPRLDFVADVSDWDESGYESVISGEVHRIRTTPDIWDWKNPTVVKQAFDEFAILSIGMTNTDSLSWAQGVFELPIVKPIVDDCSYVGHNVLGVGYTPDGIIFQNSWGLVYGYQGRAILSWEWISKYVDRIDKCVIDKLPTTHTKTPMPLEADDMALLIARKTPTSPVWVFFGAGRTWLKNWNALNHQGLDRKNCMIIPASDSVWASTQIIGVMPNGGDV